jgi:c-di-GMP-binding flagellar brake protein YcgR
VIIVARSKAKERRNFQRIKGIVNVRYAVRGRDKQKIEALPKNISRGGVGTCLTEKLHKGTLLELEITLPDNPQKVILSTGKVLWAKQYAIIGTTQKVNLYETGIKFLDVDSLAINRIYSYCL